MVIILMVAPKLTKVLPIETLLIVTDTIGFPGLAYFTILGAYDDWPTKCVVGGSFCFWPGFLMQSSLMVLA